MITDSSSEVVESPDRFVTGDENMVHVGTVRHGILGSAHG